MSCAQKSAISPNAKTKPLALLFAPSHIMLPITRPIMPPVRMTRLISHKSRVVPSSYTALRRIVARKFAGTFKMKPPAIEIALECARMFLGRVSPVG